MVNQALEPSSRMLFLIGFCIDIVSGSNKATREEGSTLNSGLRVSKVRASIYIITLPLLLVGVSTI